MTSPQSSAPSGFRPWPNRALTISVVVITLALVGLSALAWLLTGRMSMGSSMVPGLLPGGGERGMGNMAVEAPLFFGIWVTMMVAMMFPSVSPMVVSYWRISRMRNQPRAALAVFIGGYLTVWAAMGAAAYLLYLAILWAAPSLNPPAGALVGGAVLAVSGAYQLSRYKTVCLRHCRGPLEFFLGFKPGIRGAARMGSEHGLYCVGCCWGLMVVLFVLGLMNLAWMGAVAVIIFIEKVAPFGHTMAKGVGIGLIVLGTAVAAWPALSGAVV